MKTHIWMLSRRYKCKSYVGPIWWIIDYPASLVHRTNSLDVGRSREEKSLRNSANINSNIKLSINNSVKLNINVKININVKVIIWWWPPFILCVFRHICGHFQGKFCQKVRVGSEPPRPAGTKSQFSYSFSILKKWECFFKNIFQWVNVGCHCDNSKIHSFEISFRYITICTQTCIFCFKVV